MERLVRLSQSSRENNEFNIKYSLNNLLLCSSTSMKKIVWSILFFSAFIVTAQELSIKGLVTDTQNEPLAFATIFVEGTTIGVTSDLEGRFNISFEASKGENIVVSSLGFSSDTFLIKELLKESEVQIILRTSEIFLNEVVVKGGGINPSFKIMDSIWDHKAMNTMKQVDNYSCELYSKVELDLYNINRQRFDSSAFTRKFSFVLNFIDSTSETPYLPLFLTENVSQYYWSSSPYITYNKSKASKISGVNNENLSPILGKLYQSIDVYENFIDILDKTFISPLNQNGHGYYKYYIMDSLKRGDETLYKMEFMPKRKHENTFVGYFWYNTSDYALVEVEMEVSKGANVNFVKKAMMHQTFQKVNQAYMLEKDKLVVHFRPTKKSIDLIGRKSDSYKNYQIDLPQFQEILQKEKDKPEEASINASDDYWAELRHDSLNRNEQFIYHMVDTLMTIPTFKAYVNIIGFISSGYANVGPIDFGPWHSAISYDSIESWRFRAGFRTNNKFSKRLRLSAYIAYGVLDQDYKQFGQVEYTVSKHPWRKLTFTYMNDFDLENEGSDEMDNDNFFAQAIRKDLPQYFVMMNKRQMNYEFEWSDHFSSKMNLLQQFYRPFFPFQYQLEDRLIDRFGLTEFSFSLRFAYNEKSFKGYFSKAALGTKFPVLQVDYSKGLEGILGGQFNYDKVEFSIRDMFPISNIGKFKYFMKVGSIEGQVPYLALFIPKGNATHYYIASAYNSMNPYEFVSDRFASVSLAHHFDGLILNKVPLLRRLKWRSFVNYRAFGGTLNADNKRRIEGQIPVAMDGKIYQEVGTGVENVFRILRFDLVWRMSEVNNPRFKTQAFTFYGSLRFKF